MNISDIVFSSYPVVFLLALMRVSIIFSMLPVFSSSVVQSKIKALFIFWLTVMSTPVLYLSFQKQGILDSFINIDGNMLITMILSELFLSLIIATAINISYYSYKIIGELISFPLGLSMASMYDPATGQNEMIISRILWLCALFIFFDSGLYQILIIGYFKSFEIIPVGVNILSNLSISEITIKLFEILNDTYKFVLVVSLPFFLITISSDMFFWIYD